MNDNEDSRRDFLVNALGLGLITGINAARFNTACSMR